MRYTFWAPVYDALVAGAGFDDARRRSIRRLGLVRGDRLLIVGAGTGLDLDHLPPGVRVTAVDVTPAMLGRLQLRAARLGRPVATCLMDGRELAFADRAFQAVLLHLVLAVMPEPERGLAEADRVLAPGGAVAVFDKFLADDEEPSLARAALNVVARVAFSDINRRLGPMLARTSLAVEHEDAERWLGIYRIITLRKPR